MEAASSVYSGRWLSGRFASGYLKYWRSLTDIQSMSEAVPVGESLSQLHNAELRGQWEQTFVSTTRGITIVDPVTGIIESTNPAFAAMHGGTVEDFIGQPAVDTLTPEAKAQLGASPGKAGDSRGSSEAPGVRDWLGHHRRGSSRI